MAWTEGSYPLYHPRDEPHILQIPCAPQQQPTIVQHLPAASVPGGPTASIRPGHVKEDLVELMMIQNAQMHQVIMNNMTMAALSSFGYANPPQAPEIITQPVVIQEEEEEEDVTHHYYQHPPYLGHMGPYPNWVPTPLSLPPLVYQDPINLQERAPLTAPRDRRAVPPPPPPSATGTVGADIPPAAEYYNATDGR